MPEFGSLPSSIGRFTVPSCWTLLNIKPPCGALNKLSTDGHELGLTILPLLPDEELLEIPLEPEDVVLLPDELLEDVVDEPDEEELEVEPPPEEEEEEVEVKQIILEVKLPREL